MLILINSLSIKTAKVLMDLKRVLFSTLKFILIESLISFFDNKIKV